MAQSTRMLELPEPVFGAAAQKNEVPIPNTALLKELKMIRLMAMNKFAFIKPLVVVVVVVAVVVYHGRDADPSILEAAPPGWY